MRETMIIDEYSCGIPHAGAGWEFLRGMLTAKTRTLSTLHAQKPQHSMFSVENLTLLGVFVSCSIKETSDLVTSSEQSFCFIGY